MRILLVHDHGAASGGAETQTLAIRAGLQERGHQASLFSSRVELVPGFPILADRTCFGTTYGKLQVVSQTYNPSARSGLARALKELRPEVVHLRMFLSQLSPSILTLLRPIPCIWQVAWYKAICPVGTKVLPDGRGCRESAGQACLRHRCVTFQSWVLHLTQMSLFRRWCGAIDRTVAISRSVSDRLESAGLGPARVIYNGIAERPPRPLLSEPPTIAFAARLVPVKGGAQLLEAFARVIRRHPTARLLVAGSGPESPALRGLADRLGLGDRVEWLGHVDRDEMERRFASSWLQAIPGLWEEPFGNVTLEAMMRGTALVASRLGGPSEVIRDEVTGLLVPPGDVEALAEAIARILDDRDLAERMGAAGREVALAEFSMDRLVDRLLDLYREVIDEYTGA